MVSGHSAMSTQSFDSKLVYFSEEELACRCCGLINLNTDFAVHLPLLRHIWAEPLSPTSVCRCPKHNKSVGGHVRSLHLTDNPSHPTNGCMAADIAWVHWDSDKKLRFARTAWLHGWSVGLANAFCHIDRRTAVGLPRHVFTYKGWLGPFDAASVTGNV